MGGIIGMHYFHQMTWPIGFFIFSQLPNHPHDSLKGPLYQPIHLGVIGHGLQLLHTKEFAHLTNNVAHEVHTMITQEPGWSSKDQDVTLVQKLGNSLCSLIGGHVHHNMFCEMVLEHQDIHNLGWSIQLHGHLNASKVYVQEIQLEQWTQLGVGVLWTNCLHAASNDMQTLGISAPGQSFLATRSILANKDSAVAALDGLHLGGTHSVW